MCVVFGLCLLFRVPFSFCFVLNECFDVMFLFVLLCCAVYFFFIYIYIYVLFVSFVCVFACWAGVFSPLLYEQKQNQTRK